MLKVKFLEDRTVLDGLEGTDKATVFKRGQVAELPLASAERWIQRGVAVQHVAEVAATKDDVPKSVSKPKTKA